MKRFWLVMLSLGLVLAFSTSAMAVDVKFSGSFYAAGMYQDKMTFQENNTSSDHSTAFYYQRLRVQTDFIVSPGLKLVTRFDAMERIWGGARGEALAASKTATSDVDSAGWREENQNIAIDWAYINYKSPIGTFDVGYMNYGATGTIFGNSSIPNARIKYSYTIGPATINTAISKVKDQSSSAITDTHHTDADNDVYHLEGVYTWKEGKAGININYYRYAENKTLAPPYKKTYFLFTPYAIAKIGPVALQAEFNYATGKSKDYNSGAGDVDLENMSGWIDATADLGPVYFGGTFAYVSGNDPNTTKEEGGTLNGGRDWNPMLIMFNYDRTYWAGSLVGNNATTDAGTMGTGATSTTAPGAWFGQGRIGVRPIAALDIMASLSYAAADEKPLDVLNSSYGWEVDVTGTYKITNNLSYMLGFGYLFTGDYYKGTNNAHQVEDNFLVINKLTLTF